MPDFKVLVQIGGPATSKDLAKIKRALLQELYIEPQHFESAVKTSQRRNEPLEFDDDPQGTDFRYTVRALAKTKLRMKIVYTYGDDHASVETYGYGAKGEYSCVDGVPALTAKQVRDLLESGRLLATLDDMDAGSHGVGALNVCDSARETLAAIGKQKAPNSRNAA